MLSSQYYLKCITIIILSFLVILCTNPANCLRERRSCSGLVPAKGMVLSCFKRYNSHHLQQQHQPSINSSIASLELNSKEKHNFARLQSNDNCTSPSYLPGTVAYYKCLPYFTTKENTETGGFLKCTRLGNWRHKNHFNNFSCHLRAEGWINKLIDENRVVIFSKSICSYCKRVKELFKSLGVHYHAIEIDYFDSARQTMVKDALMRKTGMKSWPNIFINRQHLGGFDKAVYGYHDGSLFRLLNSHHHQYQQ